MAYLEHWVALESEHYSSLSGLVEALNASTVRLPIKEGAKVVSTNNLILFDYCIFAYKRNSGSNFLVKSIF